MILKQLPNKDQARIATARAERMGELVRKPCQKCGGKSEAHHSDYSKPLKILWLCRKHHLEWHKKYGYPPGESAFTTIKITDEAYEKVRKSSFDSRVPMGRLISELIIKHL